MSLVPRSLPWRRSGAISGVSRETTIATDWLWSGARLPKNSLRRLRFIGISRVSSAGFKMTMKALPPSMVYAYAALMKGIPFVNGAPNLTVDIPALEVLARDRGVPICGKDFKTGQTLVKTAIGPMLKARMLGMDGWFSTNILGNRDGEVLDEPANFKTKEESKLGVLEYILQPDVYPELYSDAYHKVRINYYPPRGDSKEGLGQHRPLWLARRSDAAQDQFPMLRLDTGGSLGARSRLVHGLRHSALAWQASKSGYLSTSRARSTRRRSIRSTTCSYSRRSSRTPSGG